MFVSLMAKFLGDESKCGRVNSMKHSQGETRHMETKTDRGTNTERYRGQVKILGAEIHIYVGT